MREVSQTDLALLNMPSFKAMRSFVAAARYRSFTRAADALCVTQAAISRQIRELEQHLGCELFIRGSRDLQLTPTGSLLFDSAQLSMLNIFQITERIRRETGDPHSLTLCCTHAMSTLHLSYRLKDFFAANPDVNLNVITTERFQGLEPGTHPDIFVTQALDDMPGYLYLPLCHTVIYPVCSPRHLASHPQLSSPQGLRDGTLLDLNHYGRSQLTERIDWNAWFALQYPQLQLPRLGGQHGLSSNDYNLLVQMALDDQGVVLGWDHLVRHLVQQGRLVRPVAEQLALKDDVYYLVVNERKSQEPACRRLMDWLLEQFN